MQDFRDIKVLDDDCESSLGHLPVGLRSLIEKRVENSIITELELHGINLQKQLDEL